MLGDFINRGLVMLFGYAVPAFECYKTLENNRVGMDQLRFWCQYWIIIALLTVFERFGDVFISWLPMYDEMKVVFVIYLWYPKTQGTSFVYEKFFRPYVAKHETEIERNFMEFSARAWNLAMFHWQNVADYGQTTILQLLQYFSSKSPNAKGPSPEMIIQQPFNALPPPSETVSSRRRRQPERPNQQSSKKWPWSSAPSAPPMSTMRRLESQAPKSDLIQEQLPREISLVATVMDTDTTLSASDDRTDPPTSAAWIRRRRSNPVHTNEPRTGKTM